MGTPPGPGGPGDQVLVPDSSRGPGIRDPRMGSETPFRAPPPPGEGPRGVVLHQPLAAGPRGTGDPDPGIREGGFSLLSILRAWDTALWPRGTRR